MRRIVYTAALILLAVSSGAKADTITTTDGCKYTKAADGNYYPSAHVRADGSVSLMPITTVPKTGCICGDNCTCAPGACPAKCPVQTGQVTFPQYQFNAPQSCPSCQGGSCPALSREFFRRR